MSFTLLKRNAKFYLNLYYNFKKRDMTGKIFSIFHNEREMKLVVTLPRTMIFNSRNK